MKNHLSFDSWSYYISNGIAVYSVNIRHETEVRGSLRVISTKLKARCLILVNFWWLRLVNFRWPTHQQYHFLYDINILRKTKKNYHALCWISKHNNAYAVYYALWNITSLISLVSFYTQQCYGSMCCVLWSMVLQLCSCFFDSCSKQTKSWQVGKT